MKIIWSKKAKYNFDQIQNYLEQSWSPFVTQKFVNDVLNVLVLLENNPLLGKYNPKLKCRSIVISKNITLYYELTHHYIELITFYNSRQKPIDLTNL
ncbi:type II toxin-antitoxin system RelE/ParE family toxin [Flavobacterium hungaricum]|uniref:Type II toxin-antitoxin system RelE/ParE family toxin n=1 Tax=Flavobacterium hungaricum TaxID=2082725 RepID=A0ABR9TI79_9FLAO|nr:type II toxin-antitoxin system RelE/ParE family toxin [Flavobacterium hungaricum]MBE8725058.1 type II toxin-antitoxin system RelE/ParE family toxin [Flavobacterium hungaricum]